MKAILRSATRAPSTVDKFYQGSTEVELTTTTKQLAQVSFSR